MPRMGLAIEDQRSSSTFRFEEGRGVIVSAEVGRGQGQFNSDKCILTIGIQRLTKDGKPTEDDVVLEELAIGKIGKFHAGTAAGADDDDPQDLDEDGTGGNCIYAVEGAHPDPKAKASVFARSLQDSGVRPAILSGYVPHLIGLDAKWDRQVVKYSGMEGGDKEGSNLVVKAGSENIFNLSEINKRAGGAGSNGTQKAAAKTTTAAAPTATKAAKSTPAPPVAEPADNDDEVSAKAIEVLQSMVGKGEQTKTPAQVASMMLAKFAMARIPPPLHKPIQAKVKDSAWFSETAEALGWGVNADDDGNVVSVQIPAKQ